MLSGWTKMPSFGRYLEKMNMGPAPTGAVTQQTDEEIIASAEAALTWWKDHPDKMRRTQIH
jgi:hypothetical protein